MAEKLSVWRLHMIENVQAVLAKVGGFTDSAAAKFDGLQGKIGKVQKELKGAAGEIPGLGRAMELATNPYVAGAAALAAVGAAAYKSTEAALAFDKGMHKVNVTARLGQQELNQLRDRLIDMGAKSRVPLAQIPDAFNQVISAVGDAGKATGIFEAALKGAQAGGTEVGVVAEALTNVMGAVGNATPTEALDVLFATLRVGKAEFSDIAQYLPKIIPLSNNVGIGFREIAGAFALMTTKGQTSEATTTLLQNAMSALTKTSVIYGDNSHKGFVKSGVAIFDQTGKTRQLTAIIDDLASKTSGMTDKQRQAFLAGLGLDQQAAAGFSVLAQNAADLKSFIGQTSASAGEMSEAYERSLSPADRLAIVGNRFDALMLRIGYALIPAVEKGLGLVNDALDWCAQHAQLLQDIFMAGLAPLRIWWALLSMPIRAINALVERFTGKSLTELIFGGDGSVLGAFTTFLEKAYRGVNALVEALEAASHLEFGKAYDIMAGYASYAAHGNPTMGGPKPATGAAWLLGDGGFAATMAPSISVQEKAGARKKTDKAAEPELKAGLTAVNEGGRSQRIVNVNIGSLVKDLRIQAATAGMGAREMADLVKQELVRAIAGAEQSLATP